MNINIKFIILHVPHMSSTTVCYVLSKSVYVTRYAKSNHMFIYFYGFGIIYVGSIIVAKKMDILFFDRVTAIFYAILRVVNIAKRVNYI